MNELGIVCGRLSGTFVYMFRTQLPFRIACMVLVLMVAVLVLTVRSSMAHARIDQVEQQLSNCTIVQEEK